MTNERPDVVHGVTVRKKTGCGNVYITDNEENGFKEVFLRMGKAGGCIECWCQAMGRVISFALRHGCPRERIVHALAGIQCPSPTYDSGARVLSCPDAIAKALAGKKEKDDAAG